MNLQRYRLVKDLPTFNKGDGFFMDNAGNLWLEQRIGGEKFTSRRMAYSNALIEEFPRVLGEWFEPIDQQPLIKDEKFRKAVKVWAEANMTDSVMYDKDEDCIYLCGLDKADLSVRISFDDVDVFEALERKRLYSIDELCGEEE